MATIDNPNKQDEVKKLKETIDGETRYYLPLEAELDWTSQFGYTREDYVHVKIGTEMVWCIRIPATQQQYEDYMRPILAEAQKDWRSMKCMVPSEKTGKLIRCKKPCKDCPHMKSGSVLSFDRFVDEDGYERHDHIVDEESSTLTALLLEQLMSKLEKEAPELSAIFSGMLDGDAQRELEREFGIAHGSMTDNVRAMRKILQKYVTREDIVE